MPPNCARPHVARPDVKTGPRPAHLRRLAAVVLGAACGLSVAPAAHSHAIESSLERLSALNNQLLLESRFGSGEPASDAVVRLVPPGGQPVEVGRTDAEGRLSFRLPSQAGADWELQVDGGPGHRDYLELPAAGTGPSAQVRSLPRPGLVARTLQRPPLLALGLLGLGSLGLGGVGLLHHRRRGTSQRGLASGR